MRLHMVGIMGRDDHNEGFGRPVQSEPCPADSASDLPVNSQFAAKNEAAYETAAGAHEDGVGTG